MWLTVENISNLAKISSPTVESNFQIHLQLVTSCNFILKIYIVRLTKVLACSSISAETAPLTATFKPKAYYSFSVGLFEYIGVYVPIFFPCAF